MKASEENSFVMLKLPEMREEVRVEIKREDNEVLEFEA